MSLYPLVSSGEWHRPRAVTPGEEGFLVTPPDSPWSHLIRCQVPSSDPCGLVSRPLSHQLRSSATPQSSSWPERVLDSRCQRGLLASHAGDRLLSCSARSRSPQLAAMHTSQRLLRTTSCMQATAAPASIRGDLHRSRLAEAVAAWRTVMRDSAPFPRHLSSCVILNFSVFLREFQLYHAIRLDALHH